MEKVVKRSYINKRLKYITIEEYDYNDILNLDNRIGNRKTVYLDDVLRKRLTHITNSVDTHPKSTIIKGMGIKIFFAWVTVMVEELFKGNSVEINRVGALRLSTKTSTSNYRGFDKNRKRSKQKGFYTIVECMYHDSMKNMRYRRPFWSLGHYYTNKLHRLEDAGQKF